MSLIDWWGNWRTNLTPHTGNLQATDLIECTSIVGGQPVNTAITGQQIINAASSSGATWGSITGTLSSQTDLNTALSGKQATLVSGTSIKTVNSTSLLGSGDIPVQPTLVSGTNIKTINSTPILGAGDITITNSPYAIAGNSLAGSAITGTTANTQAASTLVNSSNINAAYNLQIRSKIYKSTGSLATTVRLYINTANNLSGATLLATAASMTTGPSIQHFWRDIAIVGSQLLFYPSATASSNDFVSFTPSTFTFAAATNYYFIIAIQHSNTTDSAQSLRLQVLRY